MGLLLTSVLNEVFESQAARHHKDVNIVKYIDLAEEIDLAIDCAYFIRYVKLFVSCTIQMIAADAV